MGGTLKHAGCGAWRTTLRSDPKRSHTITPTAAPHSVRGGFRWVQYVSAAFRLFQVVSFRRFQDVSRWFQGRR
jgi:hypothetical protein